VGRARKLRSSSSTTPSLKLSLVVKNLAHVNLCSRERPRSKNDQHMHSYTRVQVSWDQHASHQVLEKWVESSLQNDHISGVGLVGSEGISSSSSSSTGGIPARCFVYTTPSNAAALRIEFVKQCINKVDSLYGRTLGCRISPVLNQFIQQDNHVRKREIVEKRKKDREEGKGLLRGREGASSQG